MKIFLAWIKSLQITSVMKFRIMVVSLFLLLNPGLSLAQTGKADELKRLESGIAAAKARVTRNERKIAIADSLINSGSQLIAESKAETRAVYAESKKLDKDYDARQKPLTRLSASKDKVESGKAKADLKAMDTQYKSDTRILENRLREAAKKATAGSANLSKGREARKNAMGALKLSQKALDNVQAKYDAASNQEENTNAKDKRRK